MQNSIVLLTLVALIAGGADGTIGGARAAHAGLPGAAGGRPAAPAEELLAGAAPPGPLADSTVTIARLHYEGGGDWYANPSSLANLLERIGRDTGLPVAPREATITLRDPALRDYPYLYMTGHGNVSFPPDEAAALRDYLLGGGFLHVDDNYGLDESFRREIASVFPRRELVEIPPDHPVFNTFHALPEGLPKVHEHDGQPPQAFGLFDRGRLMLFYSYESDLGDGWEDPEVHDDPPETREQALRMGVNLFVYAMTRGTS